MSNTGFVDVETMHAGAGSISVPGLGTFARLAGPTIAPDGTVLLGTLEGEVIALHADGSAYWNRQLPVSQTITTSPVVGRDGSVYVVGSQLPAVHDHRSGTLHKFSHDGTAPISGSTDFPIFRQGPTTIGAPNVWQFGNDEAIIVPALYPTVGSYDFHLLAFSPAGGIMADWSEYLNPGDVTGDWGLDQPLGTPDLSAGPPIPGVTVATTLGGVDPFIVAVDRFFQKTIGFSFCVGASCSPAPGFTQRFTTSHSPRALWSSATMLLDGLLVVGTDDGVVFGGPNAAHQSPITSLGTIFATPTLRPDGRMIVVSNKGEAVAFAEGAIFKRTALGGGTMARPAASRTHVFVATESGFHTLNAAATVKEFTFPWVGGGLQSPAVGPGGHVYAMASNILFVFPPPRVRPGRGGLVEGVEVAHTR
jgi:hypothetical protein